MPRRSLKVAVLFVSMAAPASALGDATVTLAAYRAMSAPPAALPSERFMAVHMASPERAAMLGRLREVYPALIR